MSFFSDDINSDDVRSPREIMSEAGEELESRNAKVKVLINETEFGDRIVLGFCITNTDYQMQLNLFEAMHRPNHSYPVVINPPTSDLPEFLQKQRYVPGTPGISELMHARSHLATFAALQGTPGKLVDNEWISSTPKEFTAKLTDLFSRDYVKAQLMSIIAPTTASKARVTVIIETEEGERLGDAPPVDPEKREE